MLEGLLSPSHLIIILVIALVVLGPKRLPEAGKGIGEAMRGFKDAISPPSCPPAHPTGDSALELETPAATEGIEPGEAESATRAAGRAGARTES